MTTQPFPYGGKFYVVRVELPEQGAIDSSDSLRKPTPKEAWDGTQWCTVGRSNNKLVFPAYSFDSEDTAKAHIDASNL